MALVLCLKLHVDLSNVSGLDADDWRKNIETRLSSLLEIQCSSSERKCKPSINYFRNTTRKQTLKTWSEKRSWTRSQMWRGNSYALWHTYDPGKRLSDNRESNDNLKIFSTENGHPNKRWGERIMESLGLQDDNEILTEGKGQPVPRIGE